MANKNDAIAKARQIAEKAKPNMRVVEVIPPAEDSEAAADIVAPNVEDARRKYGLKAAAPAKAGKELHMVVMEPKKVTDDKVPRKVTLIVSDNEVVGEQG